MIAVIGSGPAALMAADVVSKAGYPVSLFEKRKSAGRKLLVAGSSGLNVTNGLPFEEFIAHYRGGTPEFWRRVIGAFPPESWLRYIESFGIGTFLGTSGRYFVEDMKASKLLQAWGARLGQQGVRFRFDRECVGFSRALAGPGVSLGFADGSAETFAAACFALGGGSWEPQENPLRWPNIFKEHGLGFDEFTPSNVGFRVTWTTAFLKEAEGKPLKKIVLTSAKGRREGDAMITKYGIEGTPVYAAGMTGEVWLDLRPDLTAAQIVSRLRAVKENLSPIRRVGKQLSLCPAAFALVFHFTPAELLQDTGLERLAERIKAFPLQLREPRPLAEAISSAGGLRLSELDDQLMLRRFPGVYAAGEMLSWDVTTGGFLLQACVAQGFVAGQGILSALSAAGVPPPARPPSAETSEKPAQ